MDRKPKVKFILALAFIFFILLSGFINHFNKPLINKVTDYINKYGINAFMEEYYNLLGTKKDALIKAENLEMAKEMGINIDGHIPKKINKTELLERIESVKILEVRNNLAEFFTENSSIELSYIERLFLSWHFYGVKDYSNNYKKDKHCVVAWNNYIETNKKNSLYTFGLIGCNAIIGVSDDKFHLSHYDQLVNNEQLSLINEFIRKEKNVGIYIIGYNSLKVADYLKNINPQIKIYTHQKQQFLSTSYSIKLQEKKTGFEILYSVRPVSADYIPSIHNNSYGDFFNNGRFNQIFPDKKYEFNVMEFVVYK